MWKYGVGESHAQCSMAWRKGHVKYSTLVWLEVTARDKTWARLVKAPEVRLLGTQLKTMKTDLKVLLTVKIKIPRHFIDNWQVWYYLITIALKELLWKLCENSSIVNARDDDQDVCNYYVWQIYTSKNIKQKLLYELNK